VVSQFIVVGGPFGRSLGVAPSPTLSYPVNLSYLGRGGDRERALRESRRRAHSDVM
jgi:hypothetical protein